MIFTSTIVLFICCFALSIEHPVEEPTKFSLAITKENTSDGMELTSKLERAQELLYRIVDAIRIGRGRFVNSITLARNIILDQAEMLSNSTSTFQVKGDGRSQRQSVLETSKEKSSILSSPSTRRETVRLENETGQAILEKPKTDLVPRILENFLRPTPLIDGIQEEEKYGNNGDRFIKIGRSLVDKYEGFSNFLNTVIDLPNNAIRTTSRGLTEFLNQIGARIIGLQ